jgi:hypothetical protein
MKRLLSTSAIALITFATTPALAETSFGNGFTIDGHVALSHLDVGDDTETYFSTDSTVAWSNGTFGVELGLIAFVDEEENATAVFPAVSYTFGNGGKVSVGMPRPAYDEYATFKMNELSDLIGTVNIAANGKSLVTTFLTTTDVENVYGLRYDGTAGPVQFALSYHQDEDGDGALFSSSAAWTKDALTISGGLENYNFGGSDGGNIVKLRGDYDFGKFAAGLGVIAIIDNDGDSEETYEAALTWKPTDQISLTGVYATQSLFGDNLYGITGNYSFTENASVKLSAFKPSDASETGFEIGVRYTF